jgi:hypothetical protein
VTLCAKGSGVFKAVHTHVRVCVCILFVDSRDVLHSGKAAGWAIRGSFLGRGINFFSSPKRSD